MLRERKIPSGISGLRAVASRTKNAQERHRAPPSSSVWPVAPAVLGRRLDDRVDAEHQRTGDEDRAGHVGAVAEADPLVALDQPHGQDAVTIPMGTLMKKIQCQLIDCVRTPPASRPTEPPADATKP